MILGENLKFGLPFFIILGENVEFNLPFFIILGKNVEFSPPFSVMLKIGSDSHVVDGNPSGLTVRRPLSVW